MIIFAPDLDKLATSYRMIFIKDLREGKECPVHRIIIKLGYSENYKSLFHISSGFRINTNFLWRKRGFICPRMQID